MPNESITFTDPDDVEAALLSSLLAPPPQPANLAAGDTADLRNAMARFSGPDTHADRRLSVDLVTEGISNYPFTAHARQRTAQILQDRSADTTIDGLKDIGLVVPVETMTASLGVPDEDCAAIRTEVCRIVRVIGRREPSSADTDQAAVELLQRFGKDTDEAVASVSVLYQTHDATAALFASVLLANTGQRRRRPALSSTVRATLQTARIGSHELPEGTTVVLDLESTRFEFGAGPHGCPGRGIAERIVAGMIQAIREADLELDIANVVNGPDGRPTTLPLRLNPKPG